MCVVILHVSSELSACTYICMYTCSVLWLCTNVMFCTQDCEGWSHEAARVVSAKLMGKLGGCSPCQD